MSADDNALEQAREVEVVEEVVIAAMIEHGPDGHIDGFREITHAVLATLAPIRAAERQEAARAAWDDGYFHGWDDESFEERGKTPNPYRADGVTDHEQQETT